PLTATCRESFTPGASELTDRLSPLTSRSTRRYGAQVPVRQLGADRKPLRSASITCAVSAPQHSRLSTNSLMAAPDPAGPARRTTPGRPQAATATGLHSGSRGPNWVKTGPADRLRNPHTPAAGSATAPADR